MLGITERHLLYCLHSDEGHVPVLFALSACFLCIGMWDLLAHPVPRSLNEHGGRSTHMAQSQRRFPGHTEPKSSNDLLKRSFKCDLGVVLHTARESCGVDFEARPPGFESWLFVRLTTGHITCQGPSFLHLQNEGENRTYLKGPW